MTRTRVDLTSGEQVQGTLPVANGGTGSSTLTAAGIEQTANKGVANGYAGLNSSGYIPVGEMGSGSASAATMLMGNNSWVAPLRINVDSYGADPTGSADSTEAFLAAMDAGGSGAFSLEMGVGTYLIGGSGDLPTFGVGQGLIGQGSALTTVSYIGSGTAVAPYNETFDSSASGGVFGGFLINGGAASGSACGMSVGNLESIRAHDIAIEGFTGASSIGLYFHNGADAWAEQGRWTAIRLIGNTRNVVFDTGSFDYASYDFHIYANANQTGVTLQNGASLSGCELAIRGNFNTGTENTGWVLGIDAGGAGSGSSFIDNARLYIDVECDGSTGVGHSTIVMGGSSASRLTATGVLSFEGSPVAFQGASIGDAVQFGFTGILNDPVLGTSEDDSLTVQGGSQYSQTGSSASLAYDQMWIYPQFGDFQAFGVPTYPITVAGVANTYSRSKRLLTLWKQPSGGGGVCPTWPSSWVWAGADSTLSTTADGVDLVELTYFPSEDVWYADIIFSTDVSSVSTATALATARTVQTNLASTTAASFNGTANITPGVTGTLPVANGGTGAVTLTGLIKGSGTSALAAATAGTDYVAPGGALGTPSSGTLTNCTFPTLNQNTTGSSGSCTGNAATATALATGRTVQTNLASTSAATFNGSAGITPGVTGTLPVANGGTGATSASAALSALGGIGSGAIAAMVSGSSNGTAASLTLWIGTTAQYSALASYSSTTVYICT